MRALTRISIIILFLAGAMWAQTSDQSTAPNSASPHGKMGNMHDGQRGFDRMAQQLNLSDQQKTQIQGIFQNQRQQAQAVRQDTSLTPEQKQDKLKQLRASTHQQVQAVLTPEQQAKMKELRAEHGGMGPGGHRHRGDGKGPGGGMAALNLTDQQKSQMQSIMQTQRQQMQSIRNDASLTPEQRQQKMRELRQSTHQQMMGILTPEQQQQWQQMHKRGPRASGPPSAAPTPAPTSK